MAPPTACLLLILALAPQDVIPRLTLDLPIQGVIAEGDRVIRTDALSELSAKPVLGRAFELQLDEPGTVTIQLSSSLFDGYLVLRDDEGRVIVEDDDGWIGTRPQLVAKELDHGQLYSVEVGALHGREGHFELVVRRGEPEPIGDEAMAALEVDLTERAMRAAERYYGPDSDELARAIYALGDVYWYRGEYERVQPYYERALEVRTRALGAGHLETGLYVNDLGWLHYLTGRYEKAEECLERAIGIYEGVPESERLQPRYAELLGRTLTNLGEVAMRTGRHEDARDVLEWALEVHEQGLGEDDRRTLYTRKQLGLALQGLDDFAGALAVWERSLELLEAKLGPDHTEAFDVRYDLIGLLNYFVVDSEAAGNLARRNLELARQHLGPDDVHLARALYSLGLVEQSMRRNPESLELYSEAVEVATRAVGADDPETVSYLGYVGTAHKNLGDFAAARPLLEAHLDAQLRIRGPDARETGFAHLYLGDLAALEGRYRDAVGHHRDALASLRRTLGPRDLYLANPLLGIAESLDRLGETSEARAAAEECIDLLLDSLGPGHPRLLQVQEVLARVLQDVSDLAGARAVLQDAVAAAEVRLGEHHPDFATVLLAFGMLLARMGDFDEADEVLERRLLIRESIFGVEHVRYADALRMRVATARFREDWPAMIEGMERALDGIESALGAAHPSTASIRYEYGRALSERGDLERSREVLARSLADLEAALGPESHKAQEVAVFLAHVDGRLGEHEAALDRLRRTRDQAIE
ncbi:MAG: tetratricopeptide repeat protein, partial [Planctomycetota bacterium]